ncbi:MAG: hypothetical protein AMXMBFR25_17180 [Lysobacterales bacterium]
MRDLDTLPRKHSALIWLRVACPCSRIVASAFPEILKLQREKEDRKHQLAMFDRQVELQKLGHTQKLDELNINADIKETEQVCNYANRDSGVRWVEGLQSSVRPVITYAFFCLFAAVNLTSLVTLKRGCCDSRNRVK